MKQQSTRSNNAHLLNERETIITEDNQKPLMTTHEELILTADAITDNDSMKNVQTTMEEKECDTDTVVKRQTNPFEYSVPADNLSEHHPMHLQIMKSSVRRPTTYDDIINKRLEIDTGEQHNGEIAMGVVSATNEPKKKKRPCSRLDYDDIIVSNLSRTASEVVRRKPNLGKLLNCSVIHYNYYTMLQWNRNKIILKFKYLTASGLHSYLQ